jgi:signal transduction histidine kinase
MGLATAQREVTEMAEALNLVELVPVQTLDRLRELFKAVTGVPMVVTDAEGMLVTSVDEPLRYCGSLVCGDEPTLCLRRAKWDVPEPAVEQALRTEQQPGKPVLHRCPGGFRDTAVPIVVEDQTVGYAVFARSLSEPPDVDRFRDLAVAGDMAPEVGEQVAQAALVMPRERIAQVAEFLQVIAHLVASAAYDSIRARRILELEELRDSLMHMIVHDLRTPLTSIIGSLQTVMDTDYDAEITVEFVPAALASADVLLEMVNTLLDINKMESGAMDLELELASFPEVADKALAQVRGLAHEHNHELTAELDPDCPPIRADADKLRRVVVNLLGNAIKFTPDGGHIKLTARCEDEGLTFSVIDDGPGIPADDRERIFEKFGQARARQAGHRQSTGLGLTFCKMVAEAHGGRIWAESEVGQGSTFSVFIPAAPRD